MARNTDYYDAPRPYLDSIMFKPVTDTTVKSDAMVAGQAQLGCFPVVDLSITKMTSAGPQLDGITQPTAIGVRFSMPKAPYNDARVRQALMLAIDPKDLNAKASSGLSTMVITWYPPESPFADPATLWPATDRLTPG
jgi:peptide/nickel transport system substrate-binding protein